LADIRRIGAGNDQLGRLPWRRGNAVTAPKKATAATPLEIIYRRAGDLKPDPKNAKTHSAKQIKLLQGLFEEYGFINPILLKPDDTIGAGHGRHQAVIAKDPNTMVPTITKQGLSKKQWRGLMLADNKAGMVGTGWDEKLLTSELSALKLDGFNLEMTGFSTLDMTKLGIAGFEVDGGKGAETGQIGGMAFAVIVRCKDEDEQTRLLEEFGKKGLKCEALIS
jgi:hypothetical protein